MLIVTTHVTYKRNIQARSHNQICRGKTKNFTHSKCVSVVLIIHHAKRMHCVILTPATCLAVPYFSTLPHKLHDFRKKLKTTLNVFIDFLYNVCLKHLSS